jgi:hypothetical protein
MYIPTYLPYIFTYLTAYIFTCLFISRWVFSTVVMRQTRGVGLPKDHCSTKRKCVLGLKLEEWTEGIM